MSQINWIHRNAHPVLVSKPTECARFRGIYVISYKKYVTPHMDLGVLYSSEIRQVTHCQSRSIAPSKIARVRSVSERVTREYQRK